MEASLSSAKGWSLTVPGLDRLIRGLLLVYIVALPFKSLLFVERNGFLLLMALLAVWSAVNRRHFFSRTPVDVPLLAFVAWVGLTIPFAAFPLYSLQEYGKLLQQILVYYAVVFFFREQAARVPLLRLLVGALIVISLYGVVQFKTTDVGMVASFMTSEVWLTTYLVMLAPLAFALAWYEEQPWVKSLYGLAALLATVCLVLVQSRAGLLAFLVELWACAWLLRRRDMVIAAGSVTAALVLAVLLLVQVVKESDGTMTIRLRTSIPVKAQVVSFVHRLDIWGFMLERIPEHPVVGIGYGKETSKRLYAQVPEKYLPPGHEPVKGHGPHNLLLELALMVGFPGMILFIVLVAQLLLATVSGYRRAMESHAQGLLLGVAVEIVGMGVRVMFDQMLVGTLAIQFWVLAALAMIVCGQAAGSDSAQEGSRGT
jgi:O-antigen ligase